MGLESCSKKVVPKRIKLVAAAVFAATFIVYSAPAFAQPIIKITGLNDWQSGLAEQTILAVQKGIPETKNISYTAEILQTVALRLFSGYTVMAAATGKNTIEVSFKTDEPPVLWNAEIKHPSLSDLPQEWFDKDTDNMAEEVAALLQGVPVDALAWSDRALKEIINTMTEERLPGWKADLMVTRGYDGAILTVSFAPEMPLILAVNPTLVSNSIPTLLHGEMREDMMGRFAQFIGIPVKWAAKHSSDIARWAESIINDRKLVAKSMSEAEASFHASQISSLNIRVESKIYTVSAWAAIYAGTSDNSAELGLHLGRKVELFQDVDMEAYAEGILGLQDWDIEGRFGLRWRSIPIKDLWLGGEWDTEDEMWWGKLTMDQRLHKPYIWLRVRQDGKFNGALGWKATEYISFEVEYDARDNDSWSLKMLGNL